MPHEYMSSANVIVPTMYNFIKFSCFSCTQHYYANDLLLSLSFQFLPQAEHHHPINACMQSICLSSALEFP